MEINAVSLIVNADDFGLHPAINQAVCQAHQNGILSHASIMPTAPFFAEAVQISENLPTLGIGVHLTFPENLTGKGQVQLFGECLYYATHPSILRNQWREQISRVLESGITPTHLDSHQHIHIFPGILSLVFDLAREFEISRVRWLNLQPIAVNNRNLSAWIMRLIQTSSAVLHKHRSSGVQLVPSIGFRSSGFFDADLMKQTIALASEQYPDSCIEVFAHPGADNAALQQSFGWEYDWESELRALCDPEIKNQLSRLKQNRNTGESISS